MPVTITLASLRNALRLSPGPLIDDELTRLLNYVIPLIQRIAPDAPVIDANQAAVQLVGYMFNNPATQGPISNALRLSGAGLVLGSFRRKPIAGQVAGTDAAAVQALIDAAISALPPGTDTAAVAALIAAHTGVANAHHVPPVGGAGLDNAAVAALIAAHSGVANAHHVPPVGGGGGLDNAAVAALIATHTGVANAHHIPPVGGSGGGGGGGGPVLTLYGESTGTSTANQVRSTGIIIPDDDYFAIQMNSSVIDRIRIFSRSDFLGLTEVSAPGAIPGGLDKRFLWTIQSVFRRYLVRGPRNEMYVGDGHAEVLTCKIYVFSSGINAAAVAALIATHTGEANAHHAPSTPVGTSESSGLVNLRGPGRLSDSGLAIPANPLLLISLQGDAYKASPSVVLRSELMAVQTSTSDDSLRPNNCIQVNSQVFPSVTVRFHVGLHARNSTLMVATSHGNTITDVTLTGVG